MSGAGLETRVGQGFDIHRFSDDPRRRVEPEGGSVRMPHAPRYWKELFDTRRRGGGVFSRV
jgi:hypothetical protein